MMRDHARLSPDRKASHRGRNSNRKPTSRACTRSLHHQRPKGVRVGRADSKTAREPIRAGGCSQLQRTCSSSLHTLEYSQHRLHTRPHPMPSFLRPGAVPWGPNPLTLFTLPTRQISTAHTPSSGRLSPLYLPPPSSHGVCEEGRALQILHRVIPSSSLLSPLPRPLPACPPRALPAHTIWARVRGGCVQAGAYRRAAFLALLVARQRRMRIASTHAHACACRWRVRCVLRRR